MTKKKVWFVTGASKGLGLALVQQLLAKGYAVAATSRNLAELKKAVPLDSENFFPIEMDLSSEDSVRDAIQTTVDTLGGLDVVVNNAGYGQLGAMEEISDQEARQNFEVNVFGVLTCFAKRLLI
jgi:NAD(P)-dependent dehydrogenase (short-subunit alcohol dehydrogenase family)